MKFWQNILAWRGGALLLIIMWENKLVRSTRNLKRENWYVQNAMCVCVCVCVCVQDDKY